MSTPEPSETGKAPTVTQRSWVDKVMATPDGRVRAGWYASVWFIGFASLGSIVQLVATIALWPLRPFVGLLTILIAATAVLLLPSTAVSWVMCWATEGRDATEPAKSRVLRAFANTGFPLRWPALGQSLLGVVVGLALAAAVVGALDALGAISVQLADTDPWRVVLWACLLVPAAAWEEVAFRGYALKKLAQGVGPVWATIISSVLFAIVHGANDNVTIIGLLSVLAAGVALTLIVATTGDLWTAIGVHWGWNVAQATVFGIPVSGLDSPDIGRIWQTTMHEPNWLSGGDFGLEGSAIGLSAFVLLALVFAFVPWPTILRGPLPDLRTFASAGNNDEGDDARSPVGSSGR